MNNFAYHHTDMDKIEQNSTPVVLHFSANKEIEKNILLLARAEKRSKSMMIRLLVEEALEARAKNNRSAY
jgi:hypothetical protein